MSIVSPVFIGQMWTVNTVRSWQRHLPVNTQDKCTNFDEVIDQLNAKLWTLYASRNVI